MKILNQVTIVPYRDIYKRFFNTKTMKNKNNYQPNNPLHGMRLIDILEVLKAEYGWEGLGARINIRCFMFEPSIKSSLKFLRKTPWARQKVERLYIQTVSTRK